MSRYMTLEEEGREAEVRQRKASQRQWDRYVELGRRAVACPAWRWMPGMTTIDGVRVLRVDRDGYAIGARVPDRGSPEIVEVPLDAVPALEDRATQGCVRQLVQWAYPRAQAWCSPVGPRWRCWYAIGVTDGATMAEAMVLALEARGEAELEDQVDDGEEDGA